jgi:hypothetical protein
MTADDFLATFAATKRAVDFASMLALLHDGKYTGPVTFHFIHGVPTVVEFTPTPTKISLTRSDAARPPLTRSADLAHTLG